MKTTITRPRFIIEQEMDDEPVYIVDTTYDPDSEAYLIVTIPHTYRTWDVRRSLAIKIIAILYEQAKPHGS